MYANKSTALSVAHTISHHSTTCITALQWEKLVFAVFLNLYLPIMLLIPGFYLANHKFYLLINSLIQYNAINYVKLWFE